MPRVRTWASDDVRGAAGSEDLAGSAGEVPEDGEVYAVVPVVVSPVGEAFGPEFEALDTPDATDPAAHRRHGS